MRGVTGDRCTVTPHAIKGLRVVFNPTAPEHRVLCIGGLSPVNQTGKRELQMRAEAYEKYLASEDVRRGVHLMIERINAGLKRRYGLG
jgi:hypothetical protein